jgi:hypothetical protein
MNVDMCRFGGCDASLTVNGVPVCEACMAHYYGVWWRRCPCFVPLSSDECADCVAVFGVAKVALKAKYWALE